MSLRVFIAVTHLLGAGHLTRAAALARAFARSGHAVTLVSGGMPSAVVALDGVTFVQLPPVRTAGTAFRTLLDEDGAPVDEARLASRRDRLLAALREARPDVVITELFPFGRRVLAAEFLALLSEARASRPRPLVACSVRDILVAPTKAGRVETVHERLRDDFDLVLVHGDPALVPLQASWPVDDALRPLLHYTGYVDEGQDATSSLERTASSCPAVPARRACRSTRPLSRRHGPSRISPGASWWARGAGCELRGLRKAAADHVTVERARRDFRALLAAAAVSVSQAGYNTAVDLLRTGVRPVLVPFEAGQETEQRLRSECLRTRGIAWWCRKPSCRPPALPRRSGLPWPVLTAARRAGEPRRRGAKRQDRRNPCSHPCRAPAARRLDSPGRRARAGAR
jgi:predicted glycosyltransferase